MKAAVEENIAMDDRTRVAELEPLLHQLAHSVPRTRVLREPDANPLNELAKLIADSHEAYHERSHDILMRALGVHTAPAVRTPYLHEAFYERPFFRDQLFLARRRWHLSLSELHR